MPPLSQCKNCRSVITVANVMREKEVKNVPTHSVITYKCGECGFVDRLVAENQSWHDRKSHEEFVVRARERLVQGFILDLGLFETVAELQTLWRSYHVPPPFERGKG